MNRKKDTSDDNQGCGQVIDEDGRDRTPKPLLGAHSSSAQEEPDTARDLYTARGGALPVCPSPYSGGIAAIRVSNLFRIFSQSQTYFEVSTATGWADRHLSDTSSRPEFEAAQLRLRG